MKNCITNGACLVNGRATCLVPAGFLKTLVFLSVVLIVLAATGGCAEIASPRRDQPISQFSVYFNNDDLAGNTMKCDAVFPVPRPSMSTTYGAAAALEALFTGPTPAERSQGYRSFFSVRTAGLLKRLKIKDGVAYIDLHDKRQELTGATSSC